MPHRLTIHVRRPSKRKPFRAFVFEQPGNPLECVNLRSFAPLPNPRPGQVQLKMLMAPINPSDVNVLQGVYPFKPPPRTDLGTENALYVPGNEGVGVVVEVGNGVNSLKVGDRVALAMPQAGTWSNFLNIDAASLIPTGNRVTDVQAATMSQSPYGFDVAPKLCQLSGGDFVVQNGANSAVGIGLRTINLPNHDSLKQYLQDLGGDHVLTYEELGDPSIRDRVNGWTLGKPIRLALNCVSGKHTTSMMRLVGKDANLVSYGAMSKQPLSLPTSLFIFKNLTAHGFMLGTWFQRHSMDERRTVMQEIIGMLENGQIKEPAYEILPLRGNDVEITRTLQNVLSKLEEGSHGKKFILQFVD
ncbi:uncharacterized protein EI90DRAFT_3146154 [Cantharellus anzutake]|uniref:uncharacterized protein n=1 Tax=Cantharellus anzutake TaxID=1750568 RepID=UPI001908464D|nr:uncharacterized protein EI90DRAFT_3146154 [Cantharellus anzutake]KAF8328393.1 hypothetical protein EI90DRAFT_3146154 [Cantharellus anzutake]